MYVKTKHFQNTKKAKLQFYFHFSRRKLCAILTFSKTIGSKELHFPFCFVSIQLNPPSYFIHKVKQEMSKYKQDSILNLSQFILKKGCLSHKTLSHIT